MYPQSQDNGDNRRQAFGDCGHRQGNCGHKHPERIVPPENPQRKDAYANQDDKKAQLLPKDLQFFLQGGHFRLGFLDHPGNPANLRLHPGGGDHRPRPPGHGNGPHVDHVFPLRQGFCGFGEIGRVFLHRHRFTGQGRLVRPEFHRFQEAGVSRDKIPGLQYNYVPGDQVRCGNLGHGPLPPDLCLWRRKGL